MPEPVFLTGEPGFVEKTLLGIVSQDKNSYIRWRIAGGPIVAD